MLFTFLKNHGISIIALGLAVAALILSIAKSSGKSPTDLFLGVFTRKYQRDKTFDRPWQSLGNSNDPNKRGTPRDWSNCDGWQCGDGTYDKYKVWSPSAKMKVSKFIHNDTCGNYRCIECPHGREKRWVHKTWGATHGKCSDPMSGSAGASGAEESGGGSG